MCIKTYKMKLPIVIFTLAFALIACSNKQPNSQANTQNQPVQTAQNSSLYKVLSPTEFNQQMQAEPGVLLDVRTPGEYNKGFIKGAILMDIFADNFDAELAKLDKTKTYYVYCAMGGRSEEASEKMKGLGFAKIYDLDGGFSKWKSNGLPVAMK